MFMSYTRTAGLLSHTYPLTFIQPGDIVCSALVSALPQKEEEHNLTVVCFSVVYQLGGKL